MIYWLSFSDNRGFNMNISQIVALAIFVGMFALIVWDHFEKQHVTLACALLTIVLVFGLCMHDVSAIQESLNLGSIFKPGFWYAKGALEEESAGINWSTIIFLWGMMVMVEGMSGVGFFNWLCMKLAKLVRYRPLSLFVSFMILSAFLAMFIDSITVILFLSAVTIELSKLLKFDPVPMILSEIFCANLGGSATMCGDPPNIIIGTSLHYTFTDFLDNTGVIALISLLFVVIYYYLIFHKQLSAVKVSAEDVAAMPDPESFITNKRAFRINVHIFFLTVTLLISHASTGLTVAFIGAFTATLTLLAGGKHSKEYLRNVDYDTLLFFVGLFVVVSGLELTGVLELLAEFIGKISGGSLRVIVVIIITLSAICSALVDNIPFAATMIPVIRSLAEEITLPLPVLVWTLAIGTDIGGSATPIGASANVVGISVAKKNGHEIGWGKYCKTAVPATILVIVISTLIVFLRYC